MEYKFEVGDSVKIVSSGSGFSADVKGRIVTITGLGEYFGCPGYIVFPELGNKLISDYKGLNGEASFELVETETKFQVGGVVEVINSGSGIGRDYKGKLFTITEIGRYCDEVGYKIDPPAGNTKSGDYSGFIGESSFRFAEKRDSNPCTLLHVKGDIKINTIVQKEQIKKIDLILIKVPRI